MTRLVLVLGFLAATAITSADAAQGRFGNVDPSERVQPNTECDVEIKTDGTIWISAFQPFASLAGSGPFEWAAFSRHGELQQYVRHYRVNGVAFETSRQPFVEECLFLLEKGLAPTVELAVRRALAAPNVKLEPHASQSPQ